MTEEKHLQGPQKWFAENGYVDAYQIQDGSWWAYLPSGRTGSLDFDIPLVGARLMAQCNPKIAYTGNLVEFEGRQYRVHLFPVPESSSVEAIASTDENLLPLWLPVFLLFITSVTTALAASTIALTIASSVIASVALVAAIAQADMALSQR